MKAICNNSFAAAALCLAVAALSVSCSKEKDLNRPDTPQQAVQFAATLPTRTTNGGDTWVVGDSVGIYMLTANSTIAANTLAGNVPYTVTNATTGALAPAVAANTIYFPPVGNVDFVAYYPYSTAITADGKYSVSLTNQSNPATVDVLTAKATNISSSTTAAIPLYFAHALSKITINFKSGMYVKSATVAAMATGNVTLSQTPASATIDLNGGGITGGAVANIALQKAAAATAGYDATFTAIVAPHAGTTGRQLSVVVNEKTYTWELPDDDTFEAGNHYTYHATVKEEEIIVGLNYRITWDATNSRYALTNTPSNAGLFFRFGSVVGIYSANGAIQTLPTTTTDGFNSGDVAWTPTTNILSTWNDVPVYANYPMTVTPESGYHTIANVKAGKGDPCRLVGLDLNRIKNTAAALLTADDIDNHTWRLPTNAENQSFSGLNANTNSYSAHWTTLSGIAGGMFPNTTNGSAATFLPTAGRRMPNGVVDNQGLIGNYWSNTPYSNSDGYNLDFGSTSIHPLYNSLLGRGYNVRCVRQQASTKATPYHTEATCYKTRL